MVLMPRLEREKSADQREKREAERRREGPEVRLDIEDRESEKKRTEENGQERRCSKTHSRPRRIATSSVMKLEQCRPAGLASSATEEQREHSMSTPEPPAPLGVATEPSDQSVTSA